MALSYALTTVANVKGFLRTFDPEHDPLLDTLVDAATVAIEKHIQSPVIQRSFTEDYSGGVTDSCLGGAKRIYLRQYPIVSVTSITDDNSETIGAADYTIVAQRGILENDGVWERPEGRWTIVYTAGLFAAVEDVTEDIQLAAHRLIAIWFHDSRQPVTAASGPGSTGTASYGTDTVDVRTKAALMTLSRYRERMAS